MNKIFQVDAFTSEPFKGNPAGVVVLNSTKPAEWMQSVAKEMNLSETAFLIEEGDYYQLRWFTPTVEVDLCGHATLASAHILFSEGYLKETETALFQSMSGELKADFAQGWIELDFPRFPVARVEVTDLLVDALGFIPEFIYESDQNLLVEMKSVDKIKNYIPRIDLLSSLGHQGLIITSQENDGDFDFVSRYFAPRVGINEDPVTGSAHCSLAPYWAERLKKNTFLAYQASERGGVLGIQLVEDRVKIKGQAVTIFQGRLDI